MFHPSLCLPKHLPAELGLADLLPGAVASVDVNAKFVEQSVVRISKQQLTFEHFEKRPEVMLPRDFPESTSFVTVRGAAGARDAAAPPRVVQLCGAEAWLETVRTPPGDSPAHRARAAGDAVGSAQEEGGQRATLRSFTHWHGSNRELHADWEAKSVFVSLTGEFHTVLSSDSL